MSTMQVEVVSNEEQIYSGEASFVVVPTESGELGIYPRHIPLLSRVKAGVMRLVVPGQTEEVLLAVSGGLLEVQPSHITVLVEVAVRGDDLDEARAMEAKKVAEAALKNASDDKSTAKAQQALAVAIAELKTLDYLRHHNH